MSKDSNGQTDGQGWRETGGGEGAAADRGGNILSFPSPLLSSPLLSSPLPARDDGVSADLVVGGGGGGGYSYSTEISPPPRRCDESLLLDVVRKNLRDEARWVITEQDSKRKGKVRAGINSCAAGTGPGIMMKTPPNLGGTNSESYSKFRLLLPLKNGKPRSGFSVLFA